MFRIPTEEALDNLYEKSEKTAAKHPIWFRFSLFIYTLWGFVYLLLVIAFAAALGVLGYYGAFFNLLSLFISGFCLFFILTILLQIPKMIRLIKRPDYSVRLPKNSPLAQKVRKLCSDMKLSPPKNIYLTADANAWITNVGNKDSLFIGIPYLAVLSEDEITAILVHELAHITLRHGLAGRFFYNTTRFWKKIGIAMQEGFFLSAINFGRIRHFLINFTARIRVKTAVLDKKYEFEADNLAAKVSGAKMTARTLALIHIYSMLESMCSIWDDYFKQAAETNEEPPEISDFLYHTLQSLDPNLFTTLFHACMTKETEPQDSHPCLRSRIENLEQIIEPPIFTDKPVFNSILSSEDQALCKKSVDYWLRIRWTHEKKRLQGIQKYKENMEAKGTDIPFSFSYALLPYQKLLEAAHLKRQEIPNDAYILFVLGKEQLYQGDEVGLQTLLFAFNRNYQFRDMIRLEIIIYFQHYRSKEALKEFSENNQTLMIRGFIGKATSQQFEDNHSLFKPLDIFHLREISLAKAHFKSKNDISEFFLAEMKELAKRFPIIKSVYLLPLTDCYLLIIRYKTGWQRKKYDEMRREFIESATYIAFNHLPDELYIFSETQILKKRYLKKGFQFYGRLIK